MKDSLYVQILKYDRPMIPISNALFTRDSIHHPLRLGIACRIPEHRATAINMDKAIVLEVAKLENVDIGQPVPFTLP
jgi:hypothetical protein